MISVPKIELPHLTNGGVRVRINRHPTILYRESDYLCYMDEHGKENRCKIFRETDLGDVIHFDCKSHGMEDEQHWIITPFGTDSY